MKNYWEGYLRREEELAKNREEAEKNKKELEELFAEAAENLAWFKKHFPEA